MKIVLVLAAMMFLVNCGGGGSITITTPYYTHAELASDFVQRLNDELGYDVELEKTYTLETGYIVVYDNDFGTYDAYDIGAYLPSDDLSDYVINNLGDFYYDLDYIGSNQFQDYVSGIVFNEGSLVDRNTLRTAGTQQNDYLTGMANRLVQNYSVSQEAANKLAKASLLIQVMDMKGSGNAAYAEVIGNLAGTSDLDLINSALSGNMEDARSLSESASKALGMNPADTNALFGL